MKSNNSYSYKMEVIKRNGKKELVQFDKITSRIKYLLNEEEQKYVDPIQIAYKTIQSMYNGISTMELDELSSNICASFITVHPLYNNVGAKISISNLHKMTLDSFSDKIKMLYNNNNNISKEFYEHIMKNRDYFNSNIRYDRDYNFDYFGFKTLERSYLMKINNEVVERPQDMIMRVCAFIHMDDIEKAIKSYNLMSQGFFTHASPTLFNSGTSRPQLSSCFLLGTNDSIEGIFKTFTSCGYISKWSGGIGVHVSNVRASGSIIQGTNGQSSGIIPMLKVYNEIARYINQGGKRKGSIAIYLEPFHADIFEFLELRKNTGSETERARDLFLALWIPDIFMRKVEKDEYWHLMCPHECPGLTDVYGEDFDKLYIKYVEQSKFRKKIKARKLWNKILESQIETGVPYIAFKDNVNKKSNQKNIGVIKSSNLCIEIMEYSDDKEYAVCNLASIAVNNFVEDESIDISTLKIYSKTNCGYCKRAKELLSQKNIKYEEMSLDDDNKRKIFFDQFDESVKRTVPQIYINEKRIGGYDELVTYFSNKKSKTYNFDKLYEVAYCATENLNKVIDLNYYPTPETKVSNMKHRPIGLGIQGLADTYALMRYPFESEEANNLNRKIMETIYYGAVKASVDIAKKDGHYQTFKGSPFSEGKLQFHLWNDKPKFDKWDWDSLIEEVKTYGTRNSLLTSLMPTASTSQILGNNECFEPFTSNIYTRKTLAGEFTIINKHLIKDLIELNIWSDELKDKIVYYNGSIQEIEEIPDNIKELYKTVWEMKTKSLLTQAITRGPFIDQSQSMNIFMAQPDYNRLTSSHFYAWTEGLKTGIYYLRSKPSTNAIKFSINTKLLDKINNSYKEEKDEEEECLSCGA
jgi:ribonucleoside-diphosphate reductase subunit M1